MKSLQDKLIYWKNILDLNDWKIVLHENCSPNDMRLTCVAGENEWDEDHKPSVIRIIGEKDYGDRILPFDSEKTLVHELLHIKFAFIDNSGNELQDRILHQLIDSMSNALVKAKRSK